MALGRTTLFIILVFFLNAHSTAQTPQKRKHAPTCADLVWSARFMAANPQISTYCRGVYVKNKEFFAKVSIELTRVRGNRLTFRPVHPDGHMGSTRSIEVSTAWRVNLDGESVRASELLPGQQLSVYIPEDRFALALDDGSFDGDEEMISIEEAEVVEMK
ncbi:MAG: hypothetical protein AB8B57_00805 [Congregibacter sp.]